MCYTRHINSTVIKSFVCSFSIAHKAFYITRLNTYIQYIHISIFVFILWAAISFPCCRCNYILLSSSIFSTLFYPISVFVQRSSIECLQNFKFTKTRLKQKKKTLKIWLKFIFNFQTWIAKYSSPTLASSTNVMCSFTMRFNIVATQKSHFPENKPIYLFTSKHLINLLDSISFGWWSQNFIFLFKRPKLPIM